LPDGKQLSRECCLQQLQVTPCQISCGSDDVGEPLASQRAQRALFVQLSHGYDDSFPYLPLSVRPVALVPRSSVVPHQPNAVDAVLGSLLANAAFAVLAKVPVQCRSTHPEH
jgi:hypothetical protein